MRFSQILALAATAVALPLEAAEVREVAEVADVSEIAALPELVRLAERQLDRTSITENEFSRSTRCAEVVFVFARGSTERGNMGGVVGQPLGDVLRRRYSSDLQIEGVDYAALLSTNYLPGGTDLASENEMKGILNDINRRCPSAVIVTGGYSQGAAVNHRAIEDLSTAVKNQIAGVVTFGDTQNRADGGRIPNFPQNKIKIFCGELIRDTVCDGNLAGAVLAPHLSYGSDVDEAGAFLIGKIDALRKK